MTGPTSFADEVDLSTLPLARPEDEPVSTGTSFSSALRLAKDDSGWNVDSAKIDKGAAIMGALPKEARTRRMSFADFMPGRTAGDDLIDDAWDSLVAYRRTNQGFLKDVPTDRASFDKWLLADLAKRRAADKAVQGRVTGFTGNLASFAGSALGSLTDPFNAATTVVSGGGKTMAQVFARELLVNSAAELSQQPVVAMRRKEFGDELTMSEAVLNVAAAGVGSAVLGSAMQGAAPVVGKAVDQLLGPLKTPKIAALDLTDDQVAEQFRANLPSHMRTPDEAAALHVVQRSVDDAATNPFENDFTGAEAHADKLTRAGEALAAALNGDVAAFRALDRGTDPAVLRGAVPRGPTPIARAPVAGAFDAIIAIEGGTDRRTGRFLTSPAGAIGPAQVMPGTAPYAAKLAGLPFDDVRYRTDPEYNKALGRAYYVQMLREFGGDAEKAAAAYNAGPGKRNSGNGGVRGAMRRAEAAGDGTRWREFLPAETQKYVRNFRRRMGSAEPIDAGTPGLATAVADDGGDVIAARLAALDAEEAALGGRGDALPELDPINLPRLKRDGFASDDDWMSAQARVDAENAGFDVDAMARGIAADQRRARVMTAIPQVREATRAGQSINPGKLADALGMDAGEAAEALARIAAQPGSGLRVGKSGVVRRVPQRKGPVDLITTIADEGGILLPRKNPNGSEYGGWMDARHQGVGRHDLIKGRGMQRMVAGAGPLFNRNGRTLDELGERLHELGWFPERPSEDQVLELLERATREKVYRPDEATDAVSYPEGDPDTPRSIDEINAEIEDVLAYAAMEGDDGRYDFDPDIRSGESGRAGDGGEGYADQSGDPGPREADLEAGRWGDEGWEPTPDALAARFDDPAGADALAQIDSLTHDVTRIIDDGDFGDAAFIASEGAAEAPALTLARLDEEDAALAAVRACL